MKLNDWNIVKLEEIKAPKKHSLVGGPFGSNLVTRDYVDQGVPVIRGTNLSGDFRFSLEDLVFVSEEKANALLPNNAHPGDVVFTQRGTLGQIGIIPKDCGYERFVISQSQMKLTVDEEKAEPLYVFYFFKSAETIQKIHNLAFSSGVPHINLQILREFEILLPPLPIQRKIADVLSAYDDLIEVNTRRIRVLEQMAQSVYREWFGKVNTQSIPEGWETKNLFEVAEVTYGNPFKSKLFTTEPIGKPVIRIRDLPKNSTETYSTEDADEKYIVRKGDILIGMDGDFHMCKWAWKEAYLNQRVVRFRPKANISRYLLYLAVQKPIHFFNETIVGTTVAHLGDSHLRTINLLIPEQSLLEHINNILEPIYELEITLRLKNANLRRTRDLLLPRLVSGEIAVHE